MTIMTAFGAKNPDGSVSDAAREKAIKTYESYSQNGTLDLPFECIPKVDPNPYHNPDLRDREKYAEWHARWIDGTYKSILDSLDGDQNFVLPVFDPTGVAAKLNLKIPNLDLPSIIASFGVPFVAVPALLNIKPLDVPNFVPKLNGLIGIPNIPKPPPLPQIPEFPGVDSFNLSLYSAIPEIFKNLMVEIGNPGWWANFTPTKLFEVSCKVVQKIMPASQTSFPSSYQANVATITTLTSEAVAAKMAGELVGATALLRIMGEKKGYLAKKTTEPTSLDAEALLNNLYRLQSNEVNLAVLFPQRQYYYGDQFTIETIQECAQHMFTDISYRASAAEEPLTFETGNITGKDKDKGWRWNPWSKTHAGASFDCAYPMKDENGARISGIANTQILEGAQEGKPGETPFKCNGDPNKPYMIKGKLAHDLPAIYELGRWLFYDWIPQMIQDKRLIPWTENGPKVIPFRTILIGNEIYKKLNEWALKEKGSNWNFANGKINNLGWTNIAYSIFTAQNAHEDHMHWAGQRTSIDAELTSKLDGKTVHRCYPGNETSFRYKEAKKEIDDGSVVTVRV